MQGIISCRSCVHRVPVEESKAWKPNPNWLHCPTLANFLRLDVNSFCVERYFFCKFYKRSENA